MGGAGGKSLPVMGGDLCADAAVIWWRIKSRLADNSFYGVRVAGYTADIHIRIGSGCRTTMLPQIHGIVPIAGIFPMV